MRVCLVRLKFRPTGCTISSGEGDGEGDLTLSTLRGNSVYCAAATDFAVFRVLTENRSFVDTMRDVINNGYVI